VSFTKGCFTGQELVARIDSRGGHVPRHLRGLVLAGAAPPEPGTTVVVDGAEVGTVTSSAPAPGGGAVALAFVRRAVDPPAEGTVGGEPATILDLPLPG
jgi:folate-binding Fe-S cluster repair protein YgfZ